MSLITQLPPALDGTPDESDGPALLREVLRQADLAQKAGLTARAEALIQTAYELLDSILATRH